MKVIVCFDSVRVIVPCDDGEIPVRELISKAIQRYRKATGKAVSHWVDVHNLKTISGGGILDPDDQLNDVCDDREQLIADFEEEGRLPHHNGGDGASASSTGSASPDPTMDIRQSSSKLNATDDSQDEEEDEDEVKEGQVEQGPRSPLDSHTLDTSPNFPLLTHWGQEKGKNDIIVTMRDLPLGSSLRVRRGSEPALNTLGDDAIQKPLIPINNGFISLHRKQSVRESDEPNTDSSDSEDGKSSLDRRKKALIARFSRDAFRTSLSSRPEMFGWLEAQEKLEEKFKQSQLKFKEERKGPVGASTAESLLKHEQSSSPDCLVISLKNDGGPLGIHVVPASDDNGRDMGLMIQNVEPGGRIHKDGRLSQGDRIVKINDTDLAKATFEKAQEIFRNAMTTDEICLKVVKVKPKKPTPAARHPPAVLPKPRSHTPAKPSPLIMPQKAGAELTFPDNNTSFKTEPLPSTSSSAGEPSSTLKSFFMSSEDKGRGTSSANGTMNKNQPIKAGPLLGATSPTKKTPPAVPVRAPTTSLTSQQKERPINALTNTRKIGKKIAIDLKKGPLGLGFSVTSRDNLIGADIPIYIKNILPKGAAVQDGRLKPGDRLLEVNGISMTGKTQAEVVTMLRNTPQGSVVSLLVSRQEEVDARFSLPRELAQQAQHPQEPPPPPPPHKPATSMARDAAHSDIAREKIGSSSLKTDSFNVKVKEEDLRYCDGGDDHDGLQPPAPSQEDLQGERRQEVLQLEIPLNETGSAGLGVSVKGKTVTTEQGQQDLGIFVRGVIKGGAASKDGRLQLNDQLLDVNGFTLQGLSNVAAMENLRRAMMAEGPPKGCIRLTVARKIGAPSPFHLGKAAHDGNQELVMKDFYNQGELSTTSDYVDLVNHSQHNSSLSKTLDSIATNYGEKAKGEPERNGQTSASNTVMRNNSYLKATCLTDNSSFSQPMSGAFRSFTKSFSSLAATVGDEQDDDDDDDEDALSRSQSPRSQLRQRPHSTIGFFGMNDDNYLDDDEDESDMSPTSPVKIFSREEFGRQSMSEKRKGHLDPKALEVYQRAKASKEQKDAKAAFPCRRAKSFHVSGSDRHGQEPHEGKAISSSGSLPRSGSMESIPTVPGLIQSKPATTPAFFNNVYEATSKVHPQGFQSRPTAGMFRSTSMPQSQPGPQGMSLPPAQPHWPKSFTASSATGIASTVSAEEPGELQSEHGREEREEPHALPSSSAWKGTALGGRIRPCNESFRAAVDRSYDPSMHDSGVPMDTLEEESLEGGSFTFSQRSTSNRSSFSSELIAEDYNGLKKKRFKDKKPGSGLLGFLRFGKGRKSADDIGETRGSSRFRSRSEERPSHLVVTHDPDDGGQEHKIIQQFAEESRLQEQYGQNQEKQQWQIRHQQQVQLQQQQQREHQQQRDQQQQRDHQQQREQQQQQQREQQQRHISSSSVQSNMSSHSKKVSVDSPRTQSPFRPFHNENKPHLAAPSGHQMSIGFQRGEGTGTGEAPMGSPSALAASGDEVSKLNSSMTNKIDKIMQLRLQHQQQHRVRHGHYPHEQGEELYEKHLQEDEWRSNLPFNAMLPHDSKKSWVPDAHSMRSAAQSLHHFHHQAEIHNDPWASERLPDPRSDEAHHYTNTRVEDEYAQPHSMHGQRQSSLRAARNVVHNPQSSLHIQRSEHYAPGDGSLHSHRVDIHHAPSHMIEMHASNLCQEIHHPGAHQVDTHQPELHQSDLRSRDLLVHSTRTMVDIPQDMRGRKMDPRKRDLDTRGRDIDPVGRDIDPWGLSQSHHSDSQTREMSLPHHHRSHVGIYEDIPSYRKDYSGRPVSRQSMGFRNSPYPTSGIGSQSAPLSHPLSQSYPSSQSSHTLQGYDPHLLQYHHHHHHHLPSSHCHDSKYEHCDTQYDMQYDPQCNSHYNTHDDSRGGSREIKTRESFVDRQQQYFEEMNHGLPDPSRHMTYVGTQRPVSRFGEPGSAKV